MDTGLVRAVARSTRDRLVRSGQRECRALMVVERESGRIEPLRAMAIRAKTQPAIRRNKLTAVWVAMTRGAIRRRPRKAHNTSNLMVTVRARNPGVPVRQRKASPLVHRRIEAARFKVQRIVAIQARCDPIRRVELPRVRVLVARSARIGGPTGEKRFE